MSTIHPSRQEHCSAGRGHGHATSNSSFRSAPAAERWLTRAAAQGTQRIRRKMAEAVDLAKLHGSDRVDRALNTCADADRFADGDLASVLAHQHAQGQLIVLPGPQRGSVLAGVHARMGELRAMTIQTLEPPALPDELDRLLRRLRLPYVRRAAPEVIATAKSQRWDPAETLRVLLIEEAAGRDRATITMRRRASGLPVGQDL